MKGKKGQSVFDIVLFMVIVFLLVIGFGIFKYVFHTATVVTQNVKTPANAVVNMTAVFNSTFTNLDNGLNSLRYVSFAIIFGMIIWILLSNFLFRQSPVFVWLYIGVTVLAVILSAFISNSAQGIMSNPLFASTFSGTLPEGTFVLNYLPVWVTVIGILGAVVLFIGINRDNGGM